VITKVGFYPGERVAVGIATGFAVDYEVATGSAVGIATCSCSSPDEQQKSPSSARS